MENLELDLVDGSSPPVQTQANTQGGRKLSIQRCIESLGHACLCCDANCRLPSCHKMKRIVQHTKICKRKTDGGCPICKQLIALCCYHAKHCQEKMCPVPFCLTIKHKLKQQQHQQRLQQSQLLRRRMAVMIPRTTVPSGALPGNSSAGGPGGVLAGGPVEQAGVMSGQPGAGNMVQEEAARQQAPHYPGKVTPIGVIGGQPQVMPPPEMQQPPIDQWRYVPNATLQNPGLQQTAPQSIQQQQPQPPQQYLQQPQEKVLTGSHISGPILPIIHPPPTTGAAKPRPGFQKEVQQLLQILKSPNTPEQQQQILHILKSNPELMASFIKQKQLFQYQQQQAAQQQGQAEAGHQQQFQQNMLTGSHVTGPVPPIIHPPPTTGAAMPSPGFQKEVVQQFLQTLKSRNTPEQQQQILHILKSNPELMASFIKQQAAQQQGQAGAGHQQQLQHNDVSSAATAAAGLHADDYAESTGDVETSEMEQGGAEPTDTF